MNGPGKYPPVSFAEAARIAEGWPGFRWMSGELHGPCPDCGGEDRFWLSEKKGGDVGFNCRQCGGPRQETRLGLLDALRGNGLAPAPVRQKMQRTKLPARTTPADALGIWEKGQTIPGAATAPAHACNTWAARFGFEVDSWPDSLGYRGGYLLARYERAGIYCASAEKIPLKGGGKKTYGPRRDAVCILSDPPGAAECWLVEGVKDGLALAYLLRCAGIRARVVALGGVANAKPAPALYAASGRRIVLALDNDAEGSTATQRLGEALAGLRSPDPRPQRPPRNIKDWADLTAFPAPLENKIRYLQNG